LANQENIDEVDDEEEDEEDNEKAEDTIPDPQTLRYLHQIETLGSTEPVLGIEPLPNEERINSEISSKNKKLINENKIT
jgi:hypothetical protein